MPGGAVAAVEHTEDVVSRNDRQCRVHVHITRARIHPPFPPALTRKPFCSVTRANRSLPTNLGCGIRAAAAGDVEVGVLK